MSSKTTRFENLLEAVPDALVGMDQKGLIRFVNRQTESLFGYDREQLIGQPIEMLVPESLWQIYAEHRDGYFADPRARSSGLEVELVGLREDGTELAINVSLSSIDTGDLLLAITAVRDVAQRRQAVQAAQQLGAIVECSDDAIIGLTLAGTITSWNPAAERMYGYQAREIIGRSGSLLTPRDRTGELNTILAMIKKGRYVERSETTLVRKDGTAVAVSIAAAPIRDEDGQIIGASAVHRDVAEQRLAFERAQRLAAIVEGSDDAIMGSTLEGIITSWNNASERLFGYSSEEMTGNSATAVCPEDRRDEIRDVLAKVKTGQLIKQLETIRVRRDGTAFPVSLTVSPIRDPDGTIVGSSMISRDMTELKHAAGYSRSLIEAALDPLLTISRQGAIDDVNEATVRVTGVPRDQLIGTDFTGYFTDPGKAREVYEQVFAQGSVTDYPLTLRRQDGTLTDVLYNASVYRDSNGEVLGVFAAARDVTEQKKALEATEHAAAIIEHSEDAIISGSLEGTVTSWNPAAERMYGYSRAEIVGKPAELLTTRDRADEIKAVVEQIRAGRQVERLESKRIRKDGTVFPVSLTVSPIRDASGSVVGTSVIHRDLTGQKGALAVAKQMAAIIEYSDDAIVGMTLDGIITSWNPAAERMFGYPGDEIVGKTTDLLVPHDRAGEKLSILAKISAGRPVRELETIRLRKDGTSFPVSLTISPIHDEKGAIVSASVICRDISQAKRASRYSRSLLEAALDPLVTISPEGKINDVNEATVNITGVPRHKLVGTDFTQYFTDPDKAREGYRRVFAQGSVSDYPLTLRHEDGTRTNVLYNASVYCDDDGTVLGVFAAARDMTNQQEAFEATQRMAAIAEHSDDALISNTLDGMITSWNPAAERMFGYPSDEIVGRSCTLLSPADRTDEIKGVLDKVRAGQPVDDFETICRRKDGSTFPVKLTLTTIRDVGGAIVGASAIVRDMSSG